jgi:gliding motility-associated protein GldE
LDPEPPSYSTFFSIIDVDLAFGFLAIFFLLFCSALVSGAEVAFFSLSSKDLEGASKGKYSKAQMINNLLRKPQQLSATLSVANTFFNIGIVLLFFWVGQTVFASIETPILQFIIEVLVVTFLILLFGEILPKVYASRNATQYARITVRSLFVLDKLLSPITLPMHGIMLFVHQKLGREKSNFSVGQLSQALELTSSEGTSQEEQKIFEGIVSFGNTDAKQVMSPRIDIFALEVEESFQDLLPKIVENGYSRIPIYRDNIDHIEGVLFVKDLIPHIDKTHFEWTTLLRKPFFVPENKKLDNLLKDFQSMKNHLAIVVDEYGGTSGLVSLEDVIEEIVGDISDEFDGDDISFSQIDENNYLFEGKINLKDFYRIVAVDESLFEDNKGEAETLAGFILEILGNFPQKGEKISFSNCLFLIEVVDKKRIKQIKVTIE